MLFHVNVSYNNLSSLLFHVKVFSFENTNYAHYAEAAGSRSTLPLHGINGVTSTGLMKMMGLRKSAKHTALASSESNGVRSKKAKNIKVSFEF